MACITDAPGSHRRASYNAPSAQLERSGSCAHRSPARHWRPLIRLGRDSCAVPCPARSAASKPLPSRCHRSHGSGAVSPCPVDPTLRRLGGQRFAGKYQESRQKQRNRSSHIPVTCGNVPSTSAKWRRGAQRIQNAAPDGREVLILEYQPLRAAYCGPVHRLGTVRRPAAGEGSARVGRYGSCIRFGGP